MSANNSYFKGENMPKSRSKKCMKKHSFNKSIFLFPNTRGPGTCELALSVHMSITCTCLYLLSRHVESTIAVLCGNRWNFEKIYHLVNLSKSYLHFDCDDFKIYCKIQNFKELFPIHTYNRRLTLVF